LVANWISWPDEVVWKVGVAIIPAELLIGRKLVSSEKGVGRRVGTYMR